MKLKLTEALLELRRISGKSQQVLATELHTTSKTLGIYEMGKRLPPPDKLLWLMAWADRYAFERRDIYDAFTKALMDQMTPPPGYEITINFNPTQPPAQKGKK